MDHPRTAGFHHITLVCRNAENALAVYGGLLGLRLVKRTVSSDDPGAYHLYLGRGAGEPGTLVALVEWPHASAGRWGIGGVHHLALGTPGVPELLMWKRRLTDAGIRVSGPYDRGYFTSIYFADADGQIVEIATEGPGYGIDEPMEALGRELKRPPESQLRGHRDEGGIAEHTHAEPVPEITGKMRLRGIHHISGITDDLSRAHDFYTEALGLRLVKRTVNRDDPEHEHHFWAVYDGSAVAPHSAFTLFGWPSSRRQARPGVGQTHQVAFRARDEEELGSFRERLREMEVDVTPVLDRVYSRGFHFRAPDGQLLEIATDGPGFTVDEPEDALGNELSLPPWLEPHRARITGDLAPLT